MIVSRMKVLLGTTNTTDDEELLYEIVEITKSKILNYINKKVLPKELEFVLVELAIQRYNRIGSEGIASESVDGKSVSYDDDFEAYKPHLNFYMLKNNISKGYRLI